MDPWGSLRRCYTEKKTLIGKELRILVPPIGALEGVEKEPDSKVTCVCSPNKGRYLSLCPSSWYFNSTDKGQRFFLQIQPTEYRSAVLSALASSNKLFRAPTRETVCYALNAGGWSWKILWQQQITVNTWVLRALRYTDRHQAQVRNINLTTSLWTAAKVLSSFPMRRYVKDKLKSS
jgi:hypothetical protein